MVYSYLPIILCRTACRTLFSIPTLFCKKKKKVIDSIKFGIEHHVLIFYSKIQNKYYTFCKGDIKLIIFPQNAKQKLIPMLAICQIREGDAYGVWSDNFGDPVHFPNVEVYCNGIFSIKKSYLCFINTLFFLTS